MSVIKVLTDEEVFEAIKPKNRKVYINNWMKFKSLFDDFNFEFAPTEDPTLSTFRPGSIQLLHFIMLNNKNCTFSCVILWTG